MLSPVGFEQKAAVVRKRGPMVRSNLIFTMVWTLLCSLRAAVKTRVLTAGEGLGRGTGLQFSRSPVSGVRSPVSGVRCPVSGQLTGVWFGHLHALRPVASADLVRQYR